MKTISQSQRELFFFSYIFDVAAFRTLNQTDSTGLQYTCIDLQYPFWFTQNFLPFSRGTRASNDTHFVKKKNVSNGWVYAERTHSRQSIMTKPPEKTASDVDDNKCE